MTQNVLPVSYPIITTYTHHAHLFSILSNYEQALPWIYCNYIQLYINKDYYQNGWGDFYFAFPHDVRPAESCRSIRTQKIDRDLINLKWDQITDFIRDCIDRDNYVHLMVNRFFIPHYRQYQKENRKHDILVYGYDAAAEMVYVADFFKANKYSFEKVSFSDFNQAYSTCSLTCNSDYSKNTTFIYKFIAEADHNCDIGKIKNDLELYLTKNVDQHLGIYEKETTAVGIEVYDVLKNYVRQKMAKNERVYDIRAFYMLYDHKKLMGLRLKYLEEQGYLAKGGDDDLISEFSELEMQTLLIVNLLIKVNILVKHSLVTNIFEKIIANLDHMADREYELFSKLLARL